MEQLEDRTSADFEAGVEKARLGYLFAHDSKLYRHWRTKIRNPAAATGRDGGGLTGEALERAVYGLFGKHVIHETVTAEEFAARKAAAGVPV